jgi:hypothetical protein
MELAVMIRGFAEWRRRTPSAAKDHFCPESTGCLQVAVRPEGANYQWRKIPPRELSIDLEADERLGRVTG